MGFSVFPETVSAQGVPGGVEKKSIDVQFIEAKKLQLIGQLDRAIESFESIYKENRQNDAVAFELAKAYDDKGDVLLTRKYIESAIKANPENIWYNDFYAGFLLKTDELAAAKSPIAFLVAKAPNELKYYDMAIGMSLDLNDASLGQQYIILLRENFGNTEPALTRIFEYYDASKDARALGIVNELIAKYPANKNYLKLKGRWLQQNGRKEEGIGVFK